MIISYVRELNQSRSTAFCAINDENEIVNNHVENARCVDKTKFSIAARK